jgi:hypothetical protein
MGEKENYELKITNYELRREVSMDKGFAGFVRLRLGDVVNQNRYGSEDATK